MLSSSSSECGDAPPVNVCKLASAHQKVSICRLQAPPIPPNAVGLQGTADLYELADGIFSVTTNNRLIPITDTYFLVNIVFTLDGIGQFRLKEEEIKFCSINRELEVTVIELTETGAKRLQQFGANFLQVSTASDRDKNAMAQHMEGGFFSHSGDPIRLLAIAVFHLR